MLLTLLRAVSDASDKPISQAAIVGCTNWSNGATVYCFAM